MPTEKYRITVTIPEGMVERLRDYQYYSRSRNQTQAVINLLDVGLKAYFDVQPASSGPSKEAIDFAISMDSLPKDYQKILFAMLETMQASAASSAAVQG